MQCVEFEARLNDLLDERFSPSVDTALVEHARQCAGCCEKLAACDALLEGVAALPAIPYSDPSRPLLAHRVAVEVGSAPAEAFPLATAKVGREKRDPLELARSGTAAVAANTRPSPALIAMALAAAAAVLVAVVPWLAADRQPLVATGGRQPIVEIHPVRPPESKQQAIAVAVGYEDLAPIGRVSFQVAHGLTSVTNSMVSALSELRKRPIFRNADEQERSSFYAPSQSNVAMA